MQNRRQLALSPAEARPSGRERDAEDTVPASGFVTVSSGNTVSATGNINVNTATVTNRAGDSCNSIARRENMNSDTSPLDYKIHRTCGECN